MGAPRRDRQASAGVVLAPGRVAGVEPRDPLPGPVLVAPRSGRGRARHARDRAVGRTPSTGRTACRGAGPMARRGARRRRAAPSTVLDLYWDRDWRRAQYRAGIDPEDQLWRAAH